jgi:hypothetical protein
MIESTMVSHEMIFSIIAPPDHLIASFNIKFVSIDIIAFETICRLYCSVGGRSFSVDPMTESRAI